VIFGYYRDDELVYAARTRNGFTSFSREQLHRRFGELDTDACPFVNLPEKSAGCWGQGLTAEKMKDCRWLEAGTCGAVRIRRMDAGGDFRFMPHLFVG
jgi:bifunctional non-homologous end joining protein LigD